MTTTENNSVQAQFRRLQALRGIADRSITLPLSEVTFLLSIAPGNLEGAEADRYDSLASIVADTDMPLDGMPQSEIFLLVKGANGYDEVAVRAYADEAEALRTMKILNEFSSDHFEVQSIAYER